MDVPPLFLPPPQTLKEPWERTVSGPGLYDGWSWPITLNVDLLINGLRIKACLSVVERWRWLQVSSRLEHSFVFLSPLYLFSAHNRCSLWMPYRFLPEPPDNPPFLDGRSQERIEASVFWPSCRSAGGQNRARVAQVSNEFGSLPLSREPPRPLGSDVESWGFYASLRFFCLFLSSVRFRSDRAGVWYQRRTSQSLWRCFRVPSLLCLTALLMCVSEERRRARDDDAAFPGSSSFLSVRELQWCDIKYTLSKENKA